MSQHKTNSHVELNFEQSGLSIIEIMIALLLASLLTLGLVQIFTSNSQTFRLNEANARVQESGRIALEILSRGVRNAGYYGCQPINGFTNNIDTGAGYDPSIHNFDQSFAVYSGSDPAMIPAGNPAGSDYIRIARIAQEDLDLRAEDNINSANLKLTSTGSLQEGDIVFITDCVNGDIIQIGNVSPNSGTVNTPTGNNVQPGNDFTSNSPPGCSSAQNCLSAVYDQGTRVMRASAETFFIAQPAGQAEPSLRRATARGDQHDLVSGIQALRVQYAVQGGGSVNWIDAAAVDDDDWNSVLAARISILVRSAENNVVDTAQRICFPGPPWAGQDCDDDDNLEEMSDRRLYRVYTTTAAIRNRIR